MKKTTHFYKMVCNSLRFLWSLKYRVYLQGIHCEKLQAKYFCPSAHETVHHTFQRAFNTHAPRRMHMIYTIKKQKLEYDI